MPGISIYLAFNDDVGCALLKACKSDCDIDALILSQAAQVVRRNMFNGSCCFEGVFDDECVKRLLCLHIF